MTAVVVLTVILGRFVWVYPATYIPRWIPAIRRRTPSAARSMATLVSRGSPMPIVYTAIIDSSTKRPKH